MYDERIKRETRVQKKSGPAGVWTQDLLITSQMLYHLAKIMGTII